MCVKAPLEYKNTIRSTKYIGGSPNSLASGTLEPQHPERGCAETTRVNEMAEDGRNARKEENHQKVVQDFKVEMH